MTDPIADPTPIITGTGSSPYAQLKPIPTTAVDLADDSFWSRRRHLNRTATLQAQYRKLVERGYLGNFRRAAGDPQAEACGLVFRDSDLYKWLEAASWALADEENQALREQVEAVVDLIARAQEDGGYLNTCFTDEHRDERWSNLRDHHELYCAGHLFQAAVAHYRVTGETRLLDVARRLADLIADTFGPNEGRRDGVPGHPEIEMALVELARATGETRYLNQAAYFIEARGRGLIGGRPYHQDHRPFKEMERLTGHAVRALYLCTGAADLYAERGDPEIREALVRLWKRMTTRQMYVTGGLGSRHSGEAVGADYELPNARAYAETCAGIANVMWNWRMLQVDGGSYYADLLERSLYNAVLPGLSLDGTRYFYTNPLAVHDLPPGDAYERQDWYRCACCPPNIARTLAKLPGYFYSLTDDETLWIHLYATNRAEIPLGDGRTFEFRMRTRYPWSGHITTEILTPGPFTLRFRIPGWCRALGKYGPTVQINGNPWPGTVAPGQYIEIERTWAVGDSVCVDLPMPVRAVTSHPYALENTGRVALMRGPLLYCLESIDHPDVDLRDIAVPTDPDAFGTHFDPDLLDGVQVVETQGTVIPPAPGWERTLYRAEPPRAESSRPIEVRAVPYYAWGNRDSEAMQVWLKRLS